MVDLKDNVSSHAPIDPGLVLPPAVQAQRDRANALMALQGQPQSQLAQPPQQPQPQPPQFTPPPSDQLLNGGMLDNPSTPTNPGTQPFDLTLPGTAQPAPPQPPPSPAQPAPLDQPVTADEWERRFSSINGRLNMARDAIQQLSDRNEHLERLLASSAQPSSHGGNGHGMQAGDAPPLTADFSQQEIDDWGPEMLGMIRRVADTRAQQLVEQVRPHIQQTQHNARQQMIDYLDRTIPNWQQINVAQEFMDWALLPDELSGAIRRDLLRRWWEANNGPRVAAFFRSFISGLPGGPAASPQPPPVPSPTPAPQAPAASNRLSLQELATPSGTGSAAAVPPAPAAKRVYKRSEIAQFYSSRALGHFKGREQEAQAVELDIFAAQREGRVING